MTNLVRKRGFEEVDADSENGEMKAKRSKAENGMVNI